MRRRQFTMASAILAAALIPVMARAAQPCPPPVVAVSGGTSASTSCPTSTGTGYSTTFALAENPISEGGIWVTGKATGLSWNNVRTAPGKAYGAALVTAEGLTRYADPIAHLRTSFTPNQFAQGVVSRVPGYKNPSGSQEIELLLRFQITANNARGYEVLWSQTGGMCIVRWNGALGGYTLLGDACTDDGTANEAVEGDVLRAEITGYTIKVYKNGVLVLTRTDPDSMWPDGQPGIGFWPTPGATPENYCWKAFQAGSL